MADCQILKLAYAPPRRSESGSEAGSDARSGLKTFREKKEDATIVNVLVVKKADPHTSVQGNPHSGIF